MPIKLKAVLSECMPELNAAECSHKGVLVGLAVKVEVFSHINVELVAHTLNLEPDVHTRKLEPVAETLKLELVECALKIELVSRTLSLQLVVRTLTIELIKRMPKILSVEITTV
ncbi:hypothetical protein GGF32_008542 [Allomyces javanicus]|nr:hypothetical protein GGF32_008542 [Allomyces javanicus]